MITVRVKAIDKAINTLKTLPVLLVPILFIFLTTLSQSLSALPEVKVFHDDNSDVLILQFAGTNVPQPPQHRKRRAVDAHWSSVDQIRGGSGDHLSLPGDIVITPQEQIIFSDQVSVYQFSEPVNNLGIHPRRIELKDVPPMARKRSFIAQDNQDRLYINNNNGIYLAKFLKNSSIVRKIRAHQSTQTSYSNNFVIDGNFAWTIEENQSLRFKTGMLEEQREILTDEKSHLITSIAGYDNRLYIASPFKDENQWKLSVDAFQKDQPTNEHILWRQVFSPSTNGNEDSLRCLPEIAVSYQKLFLICNQDIFILGHIDGSSLFRTRINEEQEPLKGLVINNEHRLFTQGEQGVYSVSDEYNLTHYPHEKSGIPAEGLLLTSNKRLIALSLINNAIPFASVQTSQPAWGTPSPQNETVVTTTNLPASSSEVLKKQAILRIHIFDTRNEQLILENEDLIPLKSKYTGDQIEVENAYPIWRVGAPTISNTGQLYVSLDSIIKKKYLNSPYEYTPSGTDMLIKKIVGSKLDTSAPWPKKYQNLQNTNDLAYEPESHPRSTFIGMLRRLVLLFLP